MQKLLVLAALPALMLLGLAPEADAQGHFGLRIGDRDGHASINIGFGNQFRGHRPAALRIPRALPIARDGYYEPGHYETVYRQVWAPAEYRAVRHGRHHERVLVCEAGYRTVETRVWIPGRWVQRRPVCW
jgi:hypothetical protein